MSSTFQWYAAIAMWTWLMWSTASAIYQFAKLFRSAIDAYKDRTNQLREFHRYQASELAFARMDRARLRSSS
jgi:hypothetical protein